VKGKFVLSIQEQSTDRKVAKRLRAVASMRGDAAVYELSPPFMETPWSEAGDREPIAHTFVVVSAIDINYGGYGVGLGLRESETMIFPSDGVDVTEWGDLAVVEGKSHIGALAELGYEVSE